MSTNTTLDAIAAFFDSSQVPLACSDARDPEDPLLLVNDAFLRMSGYDADEVIGLNCRFLQGERTSSQTRKTIRSDFTAGRDSQVLITNYRKSGEAFDNYLFIFTLKDIKGNPRYRIGSQFEVPDLHRNKAFHAHANNLKRGLDDLNAELDTTRQQLIRSGQLIGISIKSLLQARLEMLATA
ncbi:MAG: PAS domain-containing protein [Pseudomonadota bacterium]